MTLLETCSEFQYHRQNNKFNGSSHYTMVAKWMFNFQHKWKVNTGFALTFHVWYCLMKSGRSLRWCGRLLHSCLYCSPKQHAFVLSQRLMPKGEFFAAPLSQFLHFFSLTLMSFYIASDHHNGLYHGYNGIKDPCPLSTRMESVSNMCISWLERQQSVTLQVQESCCDAPCQYSCTKKTELWDQKKDLP